MTLAGRLRRRLPRAFQIGRQRDDASVPSPKALLSTKVVEQQKVVDPMAALDAVDGARHGG